MQKLTIELNLERGTDDEPDQTATATLHEDGSASVRLTAVKVARKDVTGDVRFDHHLVVVGNTVADSFVYVPLKHHVLRAAENVAREALKRSLKEVTRIRDAHSK